MLFQHAFQGEFGARRGGAQFELPAHPPSSQGPLLQRSHLPPNKSRHRQGRRDPRSHQSVPTFGASLSLANLHLPSDEVYFTIKPSAGIQATSFTAGDKVCIATDKLLPIERFLPQPKAAGVAKKARGRGGAAGGRGRGGDRGRGGRGGGRGAPRGGRLVSLLKLGADLSADPSLLRTAALPGDSPRADVVEGGSPRAARVGSVGDVDAVRRSLSR